jgi:uncharacterized protein YjbJ (UPF0337 family)
MVDTLQFKGNWNKIKGKLKETYGELTDNDLAYEEGKEEQLLGKIQAKTGKGRDEIRKMFDDWSR